MIYYLPYKAILTFVNIASCYYSIYKYAKYFAKRHPKIIEDEKALAVVLRLEEESYSGTEKAASIGVRASVDGISNRARRFTITAVGTNLSSALAQEHQQGDDTANVDVVDFAAQPAPLPKENMFNELRRNSGRMPPPVPPPRRPFSWHRSTSGASSGSEISPFDERRQPQFPLPSPEMTTVGESFEEADLLPNKIVSPSPVHRSFSTTLLSGCSPDRSLPFGRSLSARRPSPSKSSPSQQQRILRHQSSGSTDQTFALSTPPIEPPPPAILREPYRFATLSKVEEVVRRKPPRKPEPDMDRYISALSDTDSARYGSMDRLFIREGNEGEEDSGASRKEDSIRRSTQTDRSSWASRKSRVYIS